MNKIKPLHQIFLLLLAPALNACNSGRVTVSESSNTKTCPLGYVPVVANPLVGTTNNFCVMKFEAKCIGTSCPTDTAGVNAVAASELGGSPWVSISPINAKAACTTLGIGYDLISNPEWMTIAYDIESNPSNWGSGIVGTGALFRGHTDASPGNALAVTNANDPYDGTGNTSVQAMGAGKEQRRTFTLSNGEVIWDLVGNVWEWTDWTIGNTLASGPTTCTATWTEIPNVSCGDLEAVDYMPSNPAVVTAANYNSNFGLGRFFGGTGGAAFRGGYRDNHALAGLFALSFYNSPVATATIIGFRCVYRF